MNMPSGWTGLNTAHLTDTEKRYASRWLKINPASVNGPPTGLLIGEMPGRTSYRSLTMFPHPARSIGGQLQKLSGLPVGAFLGRIARRNVFDTFQEAWQDLEALERLAKIMAAQPPKSRVVVLGERIGKCCGLSGWFKMLTHEEVEFFAIPHPISNAKMYENPAVRAGVRMAMQWAADTQVMPEAT